MNKATYIHIESWMITELKLKWNELLLFAIIYWFSKDWISWFKGSLSYIEQWLNMSRNTVITNLSNLIKKGLIKKEESSTWNIYTSAETELVSSAETDKSSAISDKSSAETEHNIYNNNNIYNILSFLKERDREELKNIKPHLEEILSSLWRTKTNLEEINIEKLFNIWNWVPMSWWKKISWWANTLIKEKIKKLWNSYQEKITKEDFYNWLQNYINEIKTRKPDSNPNSYYFHRFDLYHFLKQENWLLKFMMK
jgi:predicted transcriptional regulator